MTSDDPLDPEWESPAARLLGKEVLERDYDNARVVIAYTAGEAFKNRRGRVHGGLIAAMLDGLCGSAVRLTQAEEGAGAITLELKTSFLSSAEPGRLVGEGRVIRRGRIIAFAEADLKDAAGRLIAKASGTFRINPNESS